MADEAKNQPTPIDPENPPPAIKDIEDKTIRELRDVPVEAVPTEQLPEIAKEVKENELPEARETRRQVEATLNKPIEAIEDAINAADMADQAPDPLHGLPPHVGDTTVFMGRTFNVPLYTFIFGVLAAVTLVEVVISQLPHGWLNTIILIALSLVKASLVVWFYMHLRNDSRVFLLVLLIPVFIVMVALLFLVTVPMTSY